MGFASRLSWMSVRHNIHPFSCRVDLTFGNSQRSLHLMNLVCVMSSEIRSKDTFQTLLVIFNTRDVECWQRSRIRIQPLKDAFEYPACTGSVNWGMFVKNQHGSHPSMCKYRYPASFFHDGVSWTFYPLVKIPRSASRLTCEAGDIHRWTRRTQAQLVTHIYCCLSSSGFCGFPLWGRLAKDSC